jgi:hypothetical protein
MEQTKSYNNRGGKNRLRFSSSKSRAKQASADIYRAHIGNHLSSTSSTAVREKRVHDGSDARRKGKKLKSEDATVRFFERENDAEGFGMGRSAVIVPSKAKDIALNQDEVHHEMSVDESDKEAQLFLTGGTEFLTEIEISAQRNGSQSFHKLITDLRPLCKSFAELLHHKEKIVDLMCASLLSKEVEGGGFVANVATNDILHLLGVLARELRTELYPFLTAKIFPRIIDDMLNPPLMINTTEGQQQQQHQRAPLDVSYIEAAFRCLSYLFKYNSEELINSQDGKTSDADSLRQHYGKTICHRRDLVRKLACEAYAPLLRKCSDKGLKRHLMRTVKALATSLANADMNARSNDRNDPQINMSNNMKRARMDAIDGVSTLLFEVARGAKRVHSKTGKVVIRSLMDCFSSYNAQRGNDTNATNAETVKVQVVYEVSSQCLYKLRGHIVKGTPMEESIEPSAFGGVFDEIYRALDAAISVNKDNHTMYAVNSAIVGHIVDLITEMINFQEGRLIRDANVKQTESDRITVSLQSLLSNDVYSKADKELQHQILRLMCSTWRVNTDHPSFSLRLSKFFPQIVSPTNDSDLSPAIFLANHLLPYLPQKSASEVLIPSLLSAASSRTSNQACDESLVLLHTISTVPWQSKNGFDECDVDPDDDAANSFISAKAAQQLPDISMKVISALVQMCLRDDLKKDASNATSWMDRFSRVGYVARCLPFLVCLCCSSGDESDGETQQTQNTPNGEIIRVLKWYASMMKHMNASQDQVNENVHVVQALVLESLSKVANECHNRENSSKLQSTLQKTMTKVKSFANTLLFAYPKSCWVIRGVAAFVTSLSAIDSGSLLNDRSNETFELLSPNLAEPDHFIRLYTLQILDSYPKRPFVTDHADLDFTDDLEEGPSSNARITEESNDNAASKSELEGPCDIISVMKALECIPIAFANERKLTTQISRVEVYANTGKLPALYAESTVCHMLGLLHVKFAPIWPAAIRVIVALTTANEDPTWPYLYTSLQHSLQIPPTRFNDTPESKDASIALLPHDQTITVHAKAMLNHHNRCVLWERSKGTVDIFASSDEAERQTVSRKARADELTLFQNLWSIMTSAQNLTTTKSRLIVPLFFQFMLDQYFVFHSDDPDMHEVNLSEFVDSR